MDSLSRTHRARTASLALLGGSMLATAALYSALHGVGGDQAQASTPTGSVADQALEALLVGQLDRDGAERTLRYLARFHPDEPTRTWAVDELKTVRPAPPPPPVAVVASVPAEPEVLPEEDPEPEPEPVQAAKPAPKAAARPTSAAAPKTEPPKAAPPKAAPPKPEAHTPEPPKPEAKPAPEAVPDEPAPAKPAEPKTEARPRGAARQRAFEAAAWLPRKDLEPNNDAVATLAEVVESEGPVETAVASRPASDATEPEPVEAPEPPPPPPPPKPAPKPIPMVDIDSLTLSNDFIGGAEVVLALSGLHDGIAQCWTRSLDDDPDPDLGGAVILRFRVSSGTPALVKAIQDDSGSPSFVPCVNRLLRRADYGLEARGVVEWSMVVANGA